MEDEFDGLFETLYAMWIAEGGLTKTNVVREDLEREAAQMDSIQQKAKQLCPHGQSKLTCNTCYFNNYNQQ